MKYLSLLRSAVCLSVLMLLSFSSGANHLVGMDFFYTHISGNTYKITLIAYGNCGSGGPGTSFDALSGNTPEVLIYNGGTSVGSITLSIEAPAAGLEITPVCPADLLRTQCTNLTYTIPGIKKFVYSATYTLPGTSPVWRFIFTGRLSSSYVAGRALSITNISSSPVTLIQLVDTLNNTVSNNSSPALSVVPTPFFCLASDDNYNPGAIDPEGDALNFSLVPGMNGTGTGTPGMSTVSYLGGYSGSSPLAATGFSMDPLTGQIAFNPTILQRSLVVYNIRERRGGVLVGTSQREMTFLVLTCSSPPPSGGLSGATNGVIDDATHFHICQNAGPFSVGINPTSPDPLRRITVSWSGLPPGSSFTVAGNGTTAPRCTFSWTSTGITPGTYTFYVTYTDDNCPLAGVQTLAYTVTILPQPTITTAVVSSPDCFAKGAASITVGGTGGPFRVAVSRAPSDTIHVFTGVSGTIIDSLEPGTYTVTVFSTGCSAYSTVVITTPGFLTPTFTFTDPTYCGGNDGTIKLYHLNAGSIDVIRYTYNGVPQPPVPYLVLADSTITISGLSAGTYTSITATYGRYCVSAPVGPVVLTNPAFTMRAISFTNPSYCGFCDGTITLYGLHPFQTDTVTYTKSGIFQPPVVRFVGADSTITIAGLCDGLYDNFVARTAGSCISNRLGPVTLTVPPFTMRAISHTNPDFCGICNGTIKLYGLHPGQVDSIHYRLSGVPQTPFVALVASDSTITITGLCAGVYDNFVARTGGNCISDTLGPVTLTVPPFTMRALDHVNPDYCGICNGSIKLYGLHPGQTDTISYTFNGVAQPPHVQLIGTDSTATITGLCAGLYDNIIARTGGVCVSNTLGPVTLTVPPFTMRTLTFSNPTKCGFCDGVVTLFGLYPGQVDSVSFNIDGVPQPPVVQLIGSDSLFHLTGLCEGVYTNFVARTAGVCVSNSLGPVTLKAPPIIPAYDFVIHEDCDGDTVFFTNKSIPAADLFYRWDFGDGSTDSSVNPVHVYYVPGTYTVKLTITNTRCVDSISHSFDLNNLIVAGFISDPDSFLCQGKPVTFTNKTLGTQLQYTWYFGDGTTDTATNPVHTYINTGSYMVILAVTNYFPCFDTVFKPMVVDSMSSISLTATSVALCRGGAVTFDADYSKFGNTGLLWTFGDSTSIANENPVTHSFDAMGAMTVTATAFYRACPDTSASTQVRVYQTPGIALGPDTSICLGGEALLLVDMQNENNSKASWVWNTGETTPRKMVVQPGTYYATVSINGCEATDTVIVDNDCYMDLPNVFTPNGDGVNDYFFPRTLLTKGLITFKMDIYSRWGELIFTTNTTDGRGWDGMFNGVPQPQGVFVFMIDATFKDGQKEHHTGNVTLLR